MYTNGKGPHAVSGAGFNRRGAKDAERRSRNQSGARLSPAAACPPVGRAGTNLAPPRVETCCGWGQPRSVTLGKSSPCRSIRIDGSAEISKSRLSALFASLRFLRAFPALAAPPIRVHSYYYPAKFSQAAQISRRRPLSTLQRFNASTLHVSTPLVAAPSCPVHSRLRQTIPATRHAP